MFGLSFAEVVVIAIIAIVLFGKEDLPQNLKKFAKWFGEFKKTTTEIQHSWLQVRDEVSRKIMTEVNEVEDKIALNSPQTQEPRAEGSEPPQEQVGSALGPENPDAAQTDQGHGLQTPALASAAISPSEDQELRSRVEPHFHSARRAIQSSEIGSPVIDSEKETPRTPG